MAKDMTKKRIAVVGGGISGLLAVIKICEMGGEVDLFSYCPVKRSHSLCAQGGINACMDTKGEHDSIYEHFDDTVYGGDFLADQIAVKGMVEAAPKIIKMLDRMGVPFTRTAEGVLDLRNFGGQKNKRTCFAGSTTGQQILYALDEQVRRWEVKGAVHKYEFWEFVKIIKNKEGICRGLVAQSMNTMEVRAFRADTVILATGGPGQVFGRCTASTICNGSAVSAVYQQGAEIANPEFIQIHPTAIPGSDKNRLMSEACRGEGGRVWVYKDGKPWYFLEEMYPAYGNLVPRDVASRAIYKVCVHMGLGINGENRVYLDLSHIEHLGDVFGVRRSRPAQSSDGNLPVGALLDGRHLGRPSALHQYPGLDGKRRVRLPVPRRQPFGRELIVERGVQRHGERSRGDEVGEDGQQGQ